MKYSSPLLIEYKEIRRRIEARFMSMQSIFGHILLHLAALCTVFIYYDDRDISQIDWRISTILACWSVALLLHGLWVYRRSAMSTRAREATITDQLDERIERGDTELLNNPRDGFRLHGLLEEDIAKRASVLFPALFIVGLNAGLWMIWMLVRPDTLYPSQITFPLIVAYLIPAVVVNFVRRRGRERQFRKLFMNWSVPSQSGSQSKPKRGEDDSRLRLSDDGELIEDNWLDTSKAKRTS